MIMRQVARTGLLLSAVWVLVAASGGASAASAPRSERLPSEVAARHYRLEVTPDAAGLSFTGRLTIDVEVRRPLRRVVLNAADLIIQEAGLDHGGEWADVLYDRRGQTVALVFPRALPAGPHVLEMRYSGRIYQQASGLFALDYDTPEGRRRALFTQFENADARRFLPCWDEPGLKAAFTLTAVVPETSMALSNMPEAASEPLGGGLRRVRFQTTPPMSAYLLFFGLGDFERVRRTVRGVDLGVVVKRGDLAAGAYALDAAAHLLEYYEDYFAVRFPLPKLDLIAGPGSSQIFGAMENWGAVFAFERDLLVDPRVANQEDRQNVYILVAHEMAHQWFGDLVTMKWWDDLWLNEGFATWMENKAADHFHPEWRVWLQDLASKEAAMQEDALPGAHPVVASVSDAGQAETLFDLITYSKGAAVIRMLEAYVGEDAWREGVRRYLKAHAYAAAASEDLWRAMDLGSPRPITAMAHDFTLKPGAPLIGEQGLVCADGRTLVDLKEERMAAAPPRAPAEAWRTPVFLQALGASPARVVVPGDGPVQARTDGCSPLVLNAGQTGYFRSRYAPAGLAGLLDRYRVLEAEDQLGVLNDVAALAAAGEEPMADLMRVTKAVPPDADPVVLGALAARLEDLDRLFQDRPGRGRLRAYARGRLEPILTKIGWDARPGESDNVAVLRSSLITVLGRLDDPVVLAEARRRLAAQDADPAHADPAIRRLALYFMAVHADRSDWARLHALATSSSTELGRQQAYILLADADDPVLAKEALDLALSGEPAPTTGPDMIRAVAERHPTLAFGFATAHWSRIAPELEPGARSEFIPDLLATACDPSLIPRLDAFVRAHVPPSERAAATRAAAVIREADRVRRVRLPEVDAWLSQAL